MQRDIISHSSKVREEFTNLISAAVSSNGLAITTDLWKDNYKRLQYLGLTVHYISGKNSELQLYNRVLCTRVIDIDVVVSGEYLEKKITEILTEFQLIDNVEQICFVTDRGGNIVNSLRNFERLNCFAHLINNVVQAICKLTCVLMITNPLKKASEVLQSHRFKQYFKEITQILCKN